MCAWHGDMYLHFGHIICYRTRWWRKLYGKWQTGRRRVRGMLCCHEQQHQQQQRWTRRGVRWSVCVSVCVLGRTTGIPASRVCVNALHDLLCYLRDMHQGLRNIYCSSEASMSFWLCRARHAVRREALKSHHSGEPTTLTIKNSQWGHDDMTTTTGRSTG